MAIDQAGNRATANFGPIQIDTTAPTISATPGAGAVDRGLPLITVTGSAVVKNTAGTTLGTVSFTCFDSRGLTVALAATDTGAGVASLTYAASGAQSIPATTLSGASAQPAITTPGLTTLTYAATDAAGNKGASQSESVIVGLGFACAGPTPTFSLPQHGTLLVTGTATSNGKSAPFSQSIPF